MSQSLLVFLLSVLVFVAGAVFINYTVKREGAAAKAEKARNAEAAQSKLVEKTA